MGQEIRNEHVNLVSDVKKSKIFIEFESNKQINWTLLKTINQLSNHSFLQPYFNYLINGITTAGKSKTDESATVQTFMLTN